MKIPGKFRGTKLAAQIGYKTLKETGSVLDAVEQAVRSMELSADFNAGYGSVLTRFASFNFHKLEILDLTNSLETLKYKWMLA